MRWLGSRFTTTSSGHTLIELLVAIGLLALLLPTLLYALGISFQSESQLQKRQGAEALMVSTQESLRLIRASGWAEIAQYGEFHPVYQLDSWQLAAGSDTVGEFDRTVTISQVERDIGGEIVESGGTVDPSTLLVTVEISWATIPPQTLTSEFYLTRYLDNITYEETTEADFLEGALAGTVVQNVAGGEVVLASGGQGSWCNPFDALVEQIDLPKQGIALTISAREGLVYAGTGENASGVSFAHVDVSNENPPIATVAGTLDGYKTNNVFAEDDFAYIATDTNSEEVVIIDVTQLPYSKVGYFDIPTNTDGIKVMTNGSVGYAIASTNSLWSFDLSAKTGSRPAIDSDGLALSGTPSSIDQTGNYALITVVDGSTKLQIIDFSDPANLTVVGSAQFDSAAPVDVVTNEGGTRAYVATAYSATEPEVFILDITTKIGLRPVVGTYDTGEMSPKSITVVPGNRVIVGGVGGEEYQVIVVDNEANPSRCGGLEVDEGINDVDSVLEADGDAYSYVLTAVQNSELKIVQGGPGGGYSTTGFYESAPFDAGYSTAFNYVIATLTTPFLTTANYQVAVAEPVSGTCDNASYHFVGPDGSGDTFYLDEGAVPLGNRGSGYINPARCFKYKVYFETSEIISSPVLSDFTVNYSP